MGYVYFFTFRMLIPQYKTVLFFLQVAQYIKFEMPVLNSFVTKLREEEEREISKLTEKYVISHTQYKSDYCSCHTDDSYCKCNIFQSVCFFAEVRNLMLGKVIIFSIEDSIGVKPKS